MKKFTLETSKFTYECDQLAESYYLKIRSSSGHVRGNFTLPHNWAFTRIAQFISNLEDITL